MGKRIFALLLTALAFPAVLGASKIFETTYQLRDRNGASDVTITAQVFDNFQGNTGLFEWRYTVENMSYSNMGYPGKGLYGVGYFYLGILPYPGPDPVYSGNPFYGYRNFNFYSAAKGFFWTYPRWEISPRPGLISNAGYCLAIAPCSGSPLFRAS